MPTGMRVTRRRVLGAGVGLVATAILAACGDPDDENGNGAGSDDEIPTATPQSPEPTATSEPEAPQYPTGASDVVFRVERSGGFVPPEERVRQAPLMSLFGDGSMITLAPVIEIYPPPALLPLVETTFNEQGMNRLVQEILDTGLFDGKDKTYDALADFVTDMPTTVFTANVGGKMTTISVYGLGAEGEAPDLPEEEQEARQALFDLQSTLGNAQHEYPDELIAEPEHDYEIERLQLVTFPYEGFGSVEGIDPGEMEWPLETPPDEMGEPFMMPSVEARCAVVEGADLETMLGALREANQLTRWQSGDEIYFLINRPLLPDEEECVSPFEGMDGDGAIEHPTDEDELVLRYELTGGFVPMEFLVTNMPVASLYGDGRMITPGPQIAIYPGPALPALNLERVTEEGIQLILAEAQTAGLLQGEQVWDDLMQRVSDAATGVLTIHANGQTHRVEVYAPGMTAGGIEDFSDVLSEEEIAFREKFDAFTGKLTSLTNWLPEAVFLDVPDEYPADRLQLVSQPADRAPVGDPMIEPGHMDWPLDTPLSELGEPYSLEMSRCFVLEGEEFTTVMSALEDATQITRWDSAGESYVLHVRPLLPDEAGCVDPFS